MPTLYRDTGYSLIHLIEDIKHGNIALPDIQRPFVWSVREGAGPLRLDVPGLPDRHAHVLGDRRRRRHAADRRRRHPTRSRKLLIVDGQQRLTSLYAVLTGHAGAHEDVRGEAHHDRVPSRSTRPSRSTDAAIEKDPEFIPDITALWADGYKSTVRNFLQAPQRQPRRAARPTTRRTCSRSASTGFTTSATSGSRWSSSSSTADEEQVAEIFVRINSEGVKLNQADFILTLMSVHWEKGRRRARRVQPRGGRPDRRRAPTPKNPFIDPSPDQLLRVGVALAFRRGRLQHVYNILRGKDLDTGDRQRGAADAAVRAPAPRPRSRSLDLTQLARVPQVPHARRLPEPPDDHVGERPHLFSYALWLIGRVDFGLDLPDAARSSSPGGSSWRTPPAATPPRRRASSSPTSAASRTSPPGDGAAFCRRTRPDRRGELHAATTGTSRSRTGSTRRRRDRRCSSRTWPRSTCSTLRCSSATCGSGTCSIPSVTAPRAIERHHLFPKKYLATHRASPARGRSTPSPTWRSSTGPRTPRSAPTTRSSTGRS